MSSSDTVEGNGKIASKMKDTVYNTVSAYVCVCEGWGWSVCPKLAWESENGRNICI